MGFKRWDDESSDWGLGELGNPNPNPSLGSDGDRCSTRRIVERSCNTEEVEPGRFVRKCEKIEKILKSSAGRPEEVVVSKTEHSEDDVTDEVKGGTLSFESSGAETFAFPGFRGGFEALERGMRSDYESIERDFLGGFNQFLEAAEEMANGFFRSFGAPNGDGHREAFPFGRGRPADWQIGTDTSKQVEPAYSEYETQFRDV